MYVLRWAPWRTIVELVTIALTAAPSSGADWQHIATGVFRTVSSPHGHALVDGERCLLIGAPYHVLPTSLPASARTCELVLLTHHHRDSSANAAAFIAAGVPVRAPKRSAAYLEIEGVANYWDKSIPSVTPGRFPPLMERFWGDWTYLVHPVGLEGIRCDIGDHEEITWHNWKLVSLFTPGHSKDHVCWFARRTTTDDGENLCFSGDAMAGIGQVWSPYTLEWHHQKDEGAVAAALSLRAIASNKPTWILPEHGYSLRGKEIQPALLETADRLSELGMAKNFDAYTKSLGDVPQYRFLAPDQVGTANPQGNPVPWTRLLPHLFLSGNTYALVSADGPVLLMDPYSQNIVERVADLKRDHRAGPVEVTMISHGHNDHYTGIFALPDRASFQVWTLNQVAQVVDAPHRFLAPYVDARVPKVNRRLNDKEIVRWHEYELKIHHLPGQTVFAMGVEVQVDGKHCLFTGDNFFHQDQYSGSGGWSGRNRGLPNGYVASAEKILAMKPDWILAEHGGAFEFHPEDFRRRREFAKQATALADSISPHGDQRIDWDPQRVRIEPLICDALVGSTVTLKLLIDNPLATDSTYTVRSGRTEIATGREWTITANRHATTATEIPLEIPPSSKPGRMVVPFFVQHERTNDPSDTFAILNLQPAR